ncbi:MAG: hypothetical protein HFG57_05220 [Lachnospiraceae bacterium]|nr:hypothetical protein [Lachnospiraceae bacterium]MCI9105355.1 hypothetical protein [Lachnospiraceae bacterium]
MMVDNELLSALSDLLDQKLKSELQPIREDIRDIKLNIENVICPQINLLAENYVPAAQKYEKAVAELESMQSNIDVIAKVLMKHSDKLQKLA